VEKQRLEHFFSRFNRRKLLSSLLPRSAAGAVGTAGVLIDTPAAQAKTNAPTTSIDEWFGPLDSLDPGKSGTYYWHRGKDSQFQGILSLTPVPDSIDAILRVVEFGLESRSTGFVYSAIIVNRGTAKSGSFNILINYSEPSRS